MIWHCPPGSAATCVLAHGAGAGMRHANMQALAEALGRAGIATLRFDFPFMQAKRRRVDSREVATAAIAAAYADAASRSDLPLWLGGHSFGGRMASHAVLDHDLAPAGLIFCSFPLHPPGRPSATRAEHLSAIRRPMLFLSGTRDKLADRQLLTTLVDSLDSATLHWLETVDHGYRALKRSRRSTEPVFDEMARVARAFMLEAR